MTASRKPAPPPPPAAESAAALAEAIEAERDRLLAAEARRDQLAAQHDAAIMLDGNDPELDGLEHEMEAVARSIARHRAKIAALHDRLVLTDAAEREQGRREAYIAAAAEIKAARSWLLNDYTRLASELATGLARVRAADKLARRLNDDALPSNADRLEAPSLARHVSATDPKVERRRERAWVDQSGRPVGAVQLRDGQPPFGVKLIEREIEVEVAGRPPWFPQPLWSEVKLPRLHRDQEDFWLP